MGILNDHQLRQWGPELLYPFTPGAVQPASIDVHVDRYFLRAARSGTSMFVDPNVDNEDLFDPMIEVVEGTRFVLKPGGFALASTFEKVTIPNNLVARFEGKSSLGRLGLLTHITAGFIDPGFQGHITLELSNVTEKYWAIEPGMKIGQICFEELAEPVDIPYGDPSYGSHYQGQRGPTPSRSHLNYAKIDVFGDADRKKA